MGINIAVAGKGGTGKTTTCALIIRVLKELDKGTVLALDADSNSNLNELLGVEVSKTIGNIREDFKKEGANLPSGMYKDQMVEMNIHRDVDFLLIISDPSPRGVMTAARIRDLSKDLNINAKIIKLIVCKVQGTIDERLSDYIRDRGFESFETIDLDQKLYELELAGKNIFDLEKEAKSLKKVNKILKNMDI